MRDKFLKLAREPRKTVEHESNGDSSGNLYDRNGSQKDW